MPATDERPVITDKNIKPNISYNSRGYIDL